MRRAVLLATMLVLAGCSAPAGSPAEPATEAPADTAEAPPDGAETTTVGGASTTTSSDGGETNADPTTAEERDDQLVTVDGPDPDANESDLFRQTRALLGTDTEPPSVVVTGSPDVEFPEQGLETFRLLFLPRVDADAPRRPTRNRDWPTASPAFYYQQTHTVYIDSRKVNTVRVDIQEVLVEEFAHAVQFRNETFASYYDRRVDGLRFRPNQTTDDRLTTIAVREGVGDVYVTDRVQQESLGREPRESISRVVVSRYLRGGIGYRLAFGPYRFGYEYANRTLDGAAETFGVYGDPPRTGEQVLHPTDEAPTNLTVSVVGDDLEPTRTDTYGELFLRPVLSGGLNESAAERAADGWGYDRLVNLTYDRDGERTSGFVWVLDWDDAEEADEFERLFRAYLNDRGRTTDEGRWRFENRVWDLRRIDGDTVGIVIGPSAFADDVTVAESENGSVTVNASEPA